MGDIFKIWKEKRKMGYARGFVSVQAQDVSGSGRFISMPMCADCKTMVRKECFR